MISYDVIIADIRLPDINGYELMLRLQEILDPVPLVLMTGFGYDPGHSIVKARQAGFELVLVQAVPTGSTARHGGKSRAKQESGEAIVTVAAGCTFRPASESCIVYGWHRPRFMLVLILRGAAGTYLVMPRCGLGSSIECMPRAHRAGW